MNIETKKHIDAARQVLVGVVPNPSSQIDQITYALIYKFMDDMDQAAIKQGDEPTFFTGELEKYAWTRLMDSRIGNQERMNLYTEAFIKLSESSQLPELFRNILRSAFLPYRSPEVLGLFLKEINYFDYSHPEELGNAYEYLLSILGSQGDAGQFRTPRHIIDFIVEVVNPTKGDKVLDPACGTGGFLVKAFQHIIEQHDGKNDPDNKEKPLTPDERKSLMNNFEGYDIDPGMARIAQVNMYLHGFKNPKIYQYDTLSSEERWNDKFDVILANPPFMSPKGGIIPHKKFSVQSSRSEVLFVDYIMNHLRPKGRAGIIVPEGIIFQSGTAYKQLRKNLIEDGLYCVVSLPSGVFQPYSGVKTSILFFDNELSKKRHELLFVNIKDTGFSLGATQAPIEKNDLEPAKKVISQFRDGNVLEPSKIAFVTDKMEIENFGYDLSASKYRKSVAASTGKPFVALSEICNITKGKSSSTKTEIGLYPLYLTAKELKTADHFDFDGEGVCVPLISATGHGKAAIKRVHYVQGKFALANLLAFVEPKDIEILDPKYLYYCLDSAKDEMARLMKGAANVSMKVEDLLRFEIPLPSIEIQVEIVTEFDSYQNVIDGAKQVISNCTGGVSFASNRPLVKIGDIAELYSGGTPSKENPHYWNGDIDWIAARHVNGNLIDKSDERITDLGLKNSSSNLVPANSVILVTRVSLGKISFSTKPLAINQDLTGIRSLDENKVLTKYIFYALKSRIGLIKEAGQGIGVKGVTKEFIKNFEIPLPNIETQEAIVAGNELIDSIVDSNKKLVEIYQQKMASKINEVWGEDAIS